MINEASIKDHTSHFLSSEELTQLFKEVWLISSNDIKSLSTSAKISLEVGIKDLPPLYNFYHDSFVSETKLVYTPIIGILQRCI